MEIPEVTRDRLEPRRADTKVGPLPLLLIAFAAVATALPALNAYFRSDDFGYMYYHQRDPSQSLVSFLFAELFQEQDIWNRLYWELRPVEVLSFRLNTPFAGLEPWGYRLVSVAAHVAASMLVFVFARLALALPVFGATVAGVLFAVLPAHSEAVGWITSRGDVFVAFFALSSLLGWILAQRREPPGLGRRAWYVLSMVALVLALLTKETGAAFVLLLPAWDLVLGRREGDAPGARSAPRLARYVPPALVLVAYFTFRKLVMIEAYPANDPSTAFFRLPEFLARQGYYLGSLVIPELGRRLSNAPVWTGVALQVAFLLLGLWAALGPRRPARRAREWIYFGPAWYLATIAPLVFTYASDRHLYLPSVGLCLALGGLRVFGPERERLVAWGLAALLVGSAAWGLVRLNVAEGVRGRLSREVHEDVLATASALPDGARLVVVPPPVYEHRVLWQWILPFALLPPCSPVDHDARLAVIEHPTAFCYPKIWWEQRRDAVRDWVAASDETSPTTLVAWNQETLEMVTRPLPAAELQKRLRQIRRWLGRPDDPSIPIDEDEATHLMGSLLER